jgi:hypothetical protein
MDSLCELAHIPMLFLQFFYVCSSGIASHWHLYGVCNLHRIALSGAVFDLSRQAGFQVSDFSKIPFAFYCVISDLVFRYFSLNFQEMHYVAMFLSQVVWRSVARSTHGLLMKLFRYPRFFFLLAVM